jgi:hypothetical protein
MNKGTSRSEPAWLRALGKQDLPPQFRLDDGVYRHARTFKHDFFAATGLYEGPGGRLILKVGRVHPLFGLPMAWLGRLLAKRELRMFRTLEGVEGIPCGIVPYDTTGLVRAYVEGHPLQQNEWVDDGFFDRLDALLDKLHARDIAYVDLEKRENILVGQDGCPWLFDFQISWWWPATSIRQRKGLARCMPNALGRWVLNRLQAADRYHLLKHRRRHRPDEMSAEQAAASRRCGWLVNVHRMVFRPLTLMRRGLLKLLTGRSRSPKQDGVEFFGSHGG